MTLILVVLIAGLSLITFLFMKQAAFGSEPGGDARVLLEKSPNYSDGSFQNIEPTVTLREGASYTKMFRDFLTPPPSVKPDSVVPSIQTDLNALGSEKPVIVWFGHSSYLIKYKNYNILVDPVFSGYASPASYLGFGKAFDGTNNYGADQMPDIDLLVISHDHYDHLDYPTIRDLHTRVKRFVVPLGVDGHLKHWDVPAEKITTLDWWSNTMITDSVSITATPARHFSGRKFVRGRTQWASFVLTLGDYKIFIGGDSGYDAQFKKIGDQFGPFDIALLETGQYGADWPFIHMMPEETAQAAKDLGAKVLMPVHWGKFVLANHAWYEPVERLLKKANELEVTVTTPKIGEPVVLGGVYPAEAWWRK